jgi:hypothetical protein
VRTWYMSCRPTSIPLPPTSFIVTSFSTAGSTKPRVVFAAADTPHFRSVAGVGPHRGPPCSCCVVPCLRTPSRSSSQATDLSSKTTKYPSPGWYPHRLGTDLIPSQGSSRMYLSRHPTTRPSSLPSRSSSARSCPPLLSLISASSSWSSLLTPLKLGRGQNTQRCEAGGTWSSGSKTSSACAGSHSR